MEGQVGSSRGVVPEAEMILSEALSLWRGPPLADFTYEQFAEPAILQLEELRATALESRIDADLALGRDAEAVGELQSLCPIPSRAAARPADARPLPIGAAGRSPRGLSDGQASCSRELGIDPSPGLQELERAILRQDASVAAPAAPPTRERPPTRSRPRRGATSRWRTRFGR